MPASGSLPAKQHATPLPAPAKRSRAKDTHFHWQQMWTSYRAPAGSLAYTLLSHPLCPPSSFLFSLPSRPGACPSSLLLLSLFSLSLVPCAAATWIAMGSHLLCFDHCSPSPFVPLFLLLPFPPSLSPLQNPVQPEGQAHVSTSGEASLHSNSKLITVPADPALAFHLNSCMSKCGLFLSIW